jgi:hypothetical protein
LVLHPVRVTELVFADAGIDQAVQRFTHMCSLVNLGGRCRHHHQTKEVPGWAQRKLSPAP